MDTKLKKGRFVIALIMTVIMAFQISLPVTVFAEDSYTPVAGEAYPPEDFLTCKSSGGNTTIISYDGKMNTSYTSINIPSYINGKKVTEIAEGAFKASPYLESITLPNTVTKIGKDGFAGCIALKEMTIPGSVTEIGMLAFSSCIKMEKVHILYGVQTIGDGAFSGCTNLSEVSIAPSTKTIEGNKAFQNVPAVTVQANPDSVAGQFVGSGNNITPAELPANSPSAYKYDYDESTDEVKITEYVGTSETPIIPDELNGADVTEIGDGAFKDKPITQVTLPETLKTIGSNAFVGTKLTEVTIPDTVTGIAPGAFDDTASITLKGSSSGLDEYLQNTEFTKFEPWGPGRTKYHTLTIVQTPDLGGVILQGKNQEYKEGTQIVIEAKPTTPANTGSAEQGSYHFTEWQISSQTVDENGPDINTLIKEPNLTRTTLTMPTYDITVTAVYELIPPEPLVIREYDTDSSGKIHGVVKLYSGDEKFNGVLTIEEKWTYLDPDTNERITCDIVDKIENFDFNNSPPEYVGPVFIDPNLRVLNLPSTIDYISNQSFLRATGLEEINIDSGAYLSKDGVLFTKDMKTLVAYPANRPGTSYTIPSGVKTIAKYAFYGNRNLETIEFSDVETIEASAFYSAKSLKNINISDSVKTIEERAFSNINSLEEVHIPASVSKMGTSVFSYCYNLKTVTWQDGAGISAIPSQTFYYCAMEDVQLPTGITSIGSQAFAYCNNLTVVKLSSTVTNLASNAFAYCNSLTAFEVDEANPKYLSDDGVLFNKDKTVLMTYPTAKVSADGSYVVPDNVTTIDKNAFSSTKLENININNVTVLNNSAFSNSSIKAIDLSKITTIGTTVFGNCKGLETVTWPVAITTVSASVFAGCENLKNVIIPEGITVINAGAFANCANLKSIELPSTLKTISTNAFNGTGITEINIPDSVTSIGVGAFSHCTSLESVKLPSGISQISDSTFSYCEALKSIDISENITKIGNNAFISAGLVSVTVPSTVTSVGNAAFAGCLNLEEANVNSPMISTNMFLRCSNLKTVTTGDNTLEIGMNAFQLCTSLKQVSTKAKTIKSNAFYYCTSLESIELSDVVTIGDTAFRECSSLKTINLPNVATIGKTAFANCNSLKTINLPATLTSMGSRVFNMCENLEAINVDEGCTAYSSGDGILYNGDKTKFICYPQNKAGNNEDGTGYTVIESVTAIEDNAFESNNYLKSVDFPTNVNNFGLKVFSGTGILEEITVRSLDAAFARTNNYEAETFFSGISDKLLMELTVYGYLGSTIEDEVFAHHVKGIKFVALDEATQGLVIQKIAKDGTQTTVENKPLDENTWLGKVIGYKASDEAISSGESNTGRGVILPSVITSDMTGFIIKDVDGTEITLPEGQSIIVSVVGSNAMQYPNVSADDPLKDSKEGFYKTITSVMLPKTITTIEISAFDGCTALSKFKIPESVQKIYPYSFRDCLALTEITIPANVVMLGDTRFDELSETVPYRSAFYGCDNLKAINVEKGNVTYSSVDGVLTNKDETVIYDAPNGLTVEDGIYVVPNGIESISNSAFVGCKNLVRVEFVYTVKHIGINAFKGVLTKPNSSISFKADISVAPDIDNGAFADCTGLTKVELPIYMYELRVGDGAFANCTSLKEFDIPEGNEYFHTKDGVLFGITEKDGVKNYALVIYPLGKTETSYTVPSDIPVRQIYDSAFQDNKNIQEIVLSNDVQFIGKSAFRNCTKLNSITWGSDINRIEGMAFFNTGFTSVSIPATVAYLGQGAFGGCSSLASAEILNKKTDMTIELDVFADAKEDFTLYGYRDSKAQQYAADNNLRFEVLINKYNVTVAEGIVNGTVNVDKNSASEGEKVTITVIPNENYNLETIVINGQDVTKENTLTYSLDMPSEDVEITVTFKKAAPIDYQPINDTDSSDSSSTGENTLAPEQQPTPDTSGAEEPTL